MVQKKSWEYESLEWVHKVREEHFRKTKDLPLEEWVKPIDPEEAAKACRQLGLKVRVSQERKGEKVQHGRSW